MGLAFQFNIYVLHFLFNLAIYYISKMANFVVNILKSEKKDTFGLYNSLKKSLPSFEHAKCEPLPKLLQKVAEVLFHVLTFEYYGL